MRNIVLYFHGQKKDKSSILYKKLTNMKLREKRIGKAILGHFGYHIAKVAY